MARKMFVRCNTCHGKRKVVRQRMRRLGGVMLPEEYTVPCPDCQDGYLPATPEQIVEAVQALVEKIPPQNTDDSYSWAELVMALSLVQDVGVDQDVALQIMMTAKGDGSASTPEV